MCEISGVHCGFNFHLKSTGSLLHFNLMEPLIRSISCYSAIVKSSLCNLRSLMTCLYFQLILLLFSHVLICWFVRTDIIFEFSCKSEHVFFYTLTNLIKHKRIGIQFKCCYSRGVRCKLSKKNWQTYTSFFGHQIKRLNCYGQSAGWDRQPGGKIRTRQSPELITPA